MSTFARVGRWAALACGVAVVAYGVVSIRVAAIAPSALTWESYEQFVADYRRWPTMAVLIPPFVVTVVFPLIILAVYATVSEARRPFALLALVFAGVYTAVLGAAYWLQLTNVPWNIVRGGTDGIVGGLITFEHDSEQEAERLAADDPFRRKGLRERHWLKVWAVE